MPPRGTSYPESILVGIINCIMSKKEFIEFVNDLSCNDGMSVHMFLDSSDRDMRVGGTYHPKK